MNTSPERIKEIFSQVRKLVKHQVPIGVVLVSGCAMHPPVHPDLSCRLPQVRTIAVSPPYVEAYLNLGPHDTMYLFGSEAAQTNLALAVRSEFCALQIFTIRSLDLRDSVLAPAVPPWRVESAIHTPLSGPQGYPVDCSPMLSRPDGMAFKPRSFASPAPEIGADAALFTFAWERSRTTGSMVLDVLGWWALPLALTADLCSPGDPQSLFLQYLTRREICLGLCLIDCYTGEVLWSDVEASYGLANLEDPQTSKRLVAKACHKLRSYLPRSNPMR